MKRWTPLLKVLLVVAACLIVASAVSACPMCKDSTNGVGGYSGPFSNDGGSGNVTRGFGYSVYVMLLGLFGAIGLVSYNVARGINGPRKSTGFPVSKPRDK